MNEASSAGLMITIGLGIAKSVPTAGNRVQNGFYESNNKTSGRASSFGSTALAIPHPLQQNAAPQ